MKRREELDWDKKKIDYSLRYFGSGIQDPGVFFHFLSLSVRFLVVVVIVVVNADESSMLVEACLCVRIKSTLAKRGVHLKSAGYRVRFRTVESCSCHQ